MTSAEFSYLLIMIKHDYNLFYSNYNYYFMHNAEIVDVGILPSKDFLNYFEFDNFIFFSRKRSRKRFKLKDIEFVIL